MMGILWGPFWGIDMTLEHLDFLGATDASDEYGLGGCTASASKSDIQRFARIAEREGGDATLDNVVSKPRGRSLGTPFPTRKRVDDLTAIFCVKCTDSDHINLREANAVIRYLCWLLRSTHRHRKQVLLLVDSRVVVGAIGKGRSGSFPLNRLLKRVAALCFAGGLFLRVVYIPTEHNPADYPSRNERIPGRRQRVKAKRCPTCGRFPHQHPEHVPRRLRGTGLPCKGALGYVHRDGRWRLWFEERIDALRNSDQADDHADFLSLYDSLVSDDW